MSCASRKPRPTPNSLTTSFAPPDGYQSYWAWSTVKKGYSGVALYTKTEPLDVRIGLGIADYDAEGRTIIAEYADFVLIGAYFPNGGEENKRVPFKMAYKAAFLDVCEKLRAAGKSVIFCGDVNTAHREIDLARPKENQNTTGFLPEERAWIDQVVERGYIDIYRDLHPDQTAILYLLAVLGRRAPAQRRLAHRLFFHLAGFAGSDQQRRYIYGRDRLRSLPDQPDAGLAAGRRERADHVGMVRQRLDARAVRPGDDALALGEAGREHASPVCPLTTAGRREPSPSDQRDHPHRQQQQPVIHPHVPPARPARPGCPAGLWPLVRASSTSSGRRAGGLPARGVLDVGPRGDRRLDHVDAVNLGGPPRQVAWIIATSSCRS